LKKEKADALARIGFWVKPLDLRRWAPDQVEFSFKPGFPSRELSGRKFIGGLYDQNEVFLSYLCVLV
jgi:hypothetical protein